MIPALISRAINTRIPPDQIHQDDAFEDLGIDNLDRICIAAEVEEQFCIDLHDAEVTAWDTVADVALSVDRSRAA